MYFWSGIGCKFFTWIYKSFSGELWNCKRFAFLCIFICCSQRASGPALVAGAEGLQQQQQQEAPPSVRAPTFLAAAHHCHCLQYIHCREIQFGTAEKYGFAEQGNTVCVHTRQAGLLYNTEYSSKVQQACSAAAAWHS